MITSTAPASNTRSKRWWKVSEADEVAQSIFEQFPEFFPMKSRAYALSVAAGQMPEESITMIQVVADALMELGK